MPDVSAQTTELIGWLSTNVVILAVGSIGLLLLYRWARPALHRVLVRTMQAQAKTLGTIAVLEAVGREPAADPELGELFLAPPGYVGTMAPTATGATIRLAGGVRPESRMRVEVQMRRRVSAGLAAADVQLIRPGTGAAAPSA